MKKVAYKTKVIKKGKKAARQLSDLEFQPAAFCSRHLRGAICVFALVLSPMVFVETTASHPGVAPEIDEITHELEKNPKNVDEFGVLG